MAWDVTVVNTLAESYPTVTASPGDAAEHAMARTMRVLTVRTNMLILSHNYSQTDEVCHI